LRLESKHDSADVRVQKLSHAVDVFRKETGHDAKTQTTLGTTLAVVGRDLNVLDGSATRLEGEHEKEIEHQQVDLHAIATLDRRIALVVGKLGAEKASVHTQFLVEEHEDLVDGKATIRQIAPKIKEVYALEQKDVQAIKSKMHMLKRALDNKTYDLQSSLAKLQSMPTTKQVMLTLTTNANGQVSALAQPLGASTNTLAAQPSFVTPNLAGVARQHLAAKAAAATATATAGASTDIARTGSAPTYTPVGHGTQFATVWPQKLQVPEVGVSTSQSRTSTLAQTVSRVSRGHDSAGALHTQLQKEGGATKVKKEVKTQLKTKEVAKSKGKEGSGDERKKGERKKGGRKKGCLIHLSGVVKGLAADNSIEC